MKIGFDAKRAFYNNSGLGNYSRTLIRLINEYYPKDECLLYTPKTRNAISFNESASCQIIEPTSFFHKKVSSLWRTFMMGKIISEQKLDIFHGLSNELPFDIKKSKCRSIVSIHDLIFIRYPKLYKPLDRYIYRKKFKNSCLTADRIIAISEQTKEDIINFLKIPAEKISVIYQGCDNIFTRKTEAKQREKVRKKYKLPKDFILNVGTIEERKNSLLIVKSLSHSKHSLPLVIFGRKTPYQEQLEKYAEKNKIKERLFIVNKSDFSDFPALYQSAKLFVYPSIFEGFGIPILEALNSKIPVITSQGSCFKETGGDAALYINPNEEEELAEKIDLIISDIELRKNMIHKGIEHAQKFHDDNIAKNIHSLYEKML